MWATLNSLIIGKNMYFNGYGHMFISIQKEEQKHGEDIFLYMQSQGMYNPQ